MIKHDDKINIIADDREGKSAVTASLLAIKDVNVRIDRLSFGDYKVNNHLLFERKTLKDFAASIIDGRLFDQMIRLASSKYRGILILEGTGRDIAASGIRREAMQGALISTTLILGIPVLRSKEPDETARLMIYAARQIKSIARGGFQRPGYQPKNKRKRQLYIFFPYTTLFRSILQGLPGIGREKAVRLLDNFGSVESVITADRDELQAVEGIGKNIADGIRSAVSEQIGHYGFEEDFPI